MQEPAIPKASIQRLALYLRQLERRNRSGQKTVSSSTLGDALGLTDAQVRKDLTYFGQFGQPGIGYRISDLIPSLRKILGLDRTWNVALVGLGNLGRALVHYRGFRQQGFDIVALFDCDSELIGEEINGLVVEHVDHLAGRIHDLQIRLGVICVPAEAAQEVADRYVEAGVEGLLNFAPASVIVPKEVNLCAVDLSLELERLSFQIVRSEQEAPC